MNVTFRVSMGDGSQEQSFLCQTSNLFQKYLIL